MRLLNITNVAMTKQLQNEITLHLSAMMSECGETCMIQRCENLRDSWRILNLGHAVMIRKRPYGYDISAAFIPENRTIRQLLRQ